MFNVCLLWERSAAAWATDRTHDKQTHEWRPFRRREEGQSICRTTHERTSRDLISVSNHNDIWRSKRQTLSRLATTTNLFFSGVGRPWKRNILYVMYKHYTHCLLPLPIPHGKIKKKNETTILDCRGKNRYSMECEKKKKEERRMQIRECWMRLAFVHT